ncbi:MAG: DEAD/DEAH box helicase [bacterium]|nr:DEAD/DEAH box helicase [bacterium]
MTPTTFDGLGIAPKILEILDALKFTAPTPIQFQSIPPALTGKDIVGIAQTGTGKTLAFGIPMIQRLATLKGKGLILLPTRELALQVNEAIDKIGRPLSLRTAVLIGGEKMFHQNRALSRDPHIIIATPGRLIDHLEQRTVSLNNVVILVLDEADHMLDIGFAPQINKILQTVPRDRQTMLFSATMPPKIVALANSYMKLPIRVEVAPQGTAATNVTHEIFFVQKESKLSLLETVLKEHKGSTLVFSRTKHGAKKIAYTIRGMGHTAAEIHSNRSLSQRLKALSGFKTGAFRVLVATDIAARGIDVTNIELVVNFDLPENPEDYVHRIGRTGRAGHSGHAISFATPNQRFDIKTIERLIKKQLPVSPLPNLPRPQAQPGGFQGSFRQTGATRIQTHPFASQEKQSAKPWGKSRGRSHGGSQEPSKSFENFGNHRKRSKFKFKTKKW